MTFCIISHVDHINTNNQWGAYAPYVREMNIWLKYSDQVIIVAPAQKAEKTAIDLEYDHEHIIFFEVPSFHLKTIKSKIETIGQLPFVFWKVFCAMQKADHIHLRCPGNMGLIGAVVQILFPKKKKTAKYAGNWDIKAKQPWSYRLQRWLLSNTFLTRNIQVLVYGVWANQTKNIKPFFTATYAESEKDFNYNKNTNSNINKHDENISTPLNETLEPLSVQAKSRIEAESRTQLKSKKQRNLLFVGTLSAGKRPLYAIQLAEKLMQSGFDINLDLLGEGKERPTLENYIKKNNLQGFIFLRGNQDKEVTIQAYKTSDLMILPSKSEGWPKAVAEAMFWGCVPVVTTISCVPYMIDNGKRGLTLTLDIAQDTQLLIDLLNDQATLENMSLKAQKWSQQYTLDKFEAEIVKLLKEA